MNSRRYTLTTTYEDAQWHARITAPRAEFATGYALTEHGAIMEAAISLMLHGTPTHGPSPERETPDE